MYTLLFLMVAFGLGTLQAVFGTVLDRFEIYDKNASSVGIILLGLSFGVALSLLVNVLHMRFEHRSVNLKCEWVR
jgi:hypothetical protein